MFSFFRSKKTAAHAPGVPTISASDLPDWKIRLGNDDGTKYPGGFGPTELLTLDYWTLRARSAELFERNLYARGLIRRLAVNVINTGLQLEAEPEGSVLGLSDDELLTWSEQVENRFKLWADEPTLCDHRELKTFGETQAEAWIEALVTGDVLCIIQQDRRTGLPRLRLVPGSKIRTPMDKMMHAAGQNRVVQGVELDSAGRHVAFWVQQDPQPGDLIGLPKYKRLPAYGEKSGRRMAWLVYASEKRYDQVRGKPFLSLILQSLKEIDRYRDSVQRKAVINAMVAMFIKRDMAKPGGTRMAAGVGGGAVRKDVETALDGKGKERSFNVAEHFPGLVLDELQPGETPHGFTPNGTDEKFADFEAAIVYTLAWANNVPPEILTQSFAHNYSASQAAINEFKIYLNVARQNWGNGFCRPVYVEWLISSALTNKVTATGLLDAWRDFKKHDTFTAWVACDWTGHIKPAVDLSKLVKGYEIARDNGWLTNARAARELFGTRYSKNVKQLTRENAELAEARRPLEELKRPIETVESEDIDVDFEDDDKEQ